MRYMVMLCCLLLLAACDSSRTTAVVTDQSITDQTKAGIVTMKYVDFTDSEYATMRAAGASDLMIFELSNLQEKSHVAFWIEHYLDGKLQEKLMSFQSEVGDSKAAHKLYISTNGASTDEQLWTVSFREANNVSSGKSKVNSDNAQARIIQPVNEVTLLSEPATIGYMFVGNGNQDITTSNHQDEDAAVVSAHREVYVFKLQLS